jgi:hypothetical protein
MRRIVIPFLIVLLFAFSFIMATQPLVRGDIGPHSHGVVIEGAHMVSEGAYFRFWIYNELPYTVNVSVNGGDALVVPSRSGVDYDVVAPFISVPFEQVTYKVSIMDGDAVPTNVDVTVLVMNSALVQIFNLAIPILIIIAGIIIALFAIVIVRRQRSHKKA